MDEYKKTKHYADYQKKIKEWKQQCKDIENKSKIDSEKIVPTIPTRKTKQLWYWTRNN